MEKTPKNNDLSKVLEKRHELNWVALTPNFERVVDYAADLPSLKQKVAEQDVVFMKAPASDTVYLLLLV